MFFEYLSLHTLYFINNIGNNTCQDIENLPEYVKYVTGVNIHVTPS